MASFAPSSYPCIPGPDDSLDMIEQDSFAIEQVLRGDVRSATVDLPIHELRSPTFPAAFAEGRRYLLMLRPSPASRKQLADPKSLWAMQDQLRTAEVVAVIDLDARADEAAAERLIATRTANRPGLRFDPSFWAGLRATATVAPATHRAAIGLLLDEVLTPKATLADVRAWLGRPDRQRLRSNGAREDQYVLSRPSYEGAGDGSLYGTLTIHYDGRLDLAGYMLEYLRWRSEPHAKSSSVIPDADRRALGLPSAEWPKR